MVEKRRLAVTRIVTASDITIAISFLFSHRRKKRDEKAMLFDIATLDETGLNLSHLTKSECVFFNFSREKLKMEYYSGERCRYNNLLSELQRFGQARGYDVVVKSTTISY